LADKNLEPRVFAPFDRVRRVSDVRPQFATLVLIAPEAGLAVGFSLFSECEERAPRFAVLAFDLLNGWRAERTAVPSAVLVDLPNVAVRVFEVGSALIIDLVPESG